MIKNKPEDGWFSQRGLGMLLGKNFDDIDETTCQALIDAGASESVHLEFKLESYGSADKDKKELLKDVTAFANTLGGYLIIGINEQDGAASSIVPLSEIDVDQELQRLENITRSSIEPLIIGLRMKRIDVDGGSVIVIHVPCSFNPPHRVIFKNSNRYYARNSAGVHELSLEELRLLFGEARSIEESAKTFVSERFLRIQAKEGAIPLPTSDGIWIMHLVPLPDFTTEHRVDIQNLKKQLNNFWPIDAGGLDQRANLEGYCFYMPGEVCHGYTQIFRNKCIEATTASMSTKRDGNICFSDKYLPERLLITLQNYMKGLRELEASPPILLQISAIGINHMDTVRGSYALDNPSRYSREGLHLPPTVIAEYKENDNYSPVIAEQMNFLWNAFGHERCYYFDEDGKWIGS
jgi:hypothetical protein